MSIDFEHAHTCHGLPAVEVAQRIELFFMDEGYTRVQENDCLHFKRGTGWAKWQIEQCETHVIVCLQPMQDSVRLDAHVTVQAIQAFVSQIDRMYWQLEWRSLLAVLAGEHVPDWKAAYVACRNDYTRKVLPLFYGLLFLFGLLTLAALSRVGVLPWGTIPLLAVGYVTSQCIGTTLLGLALVNLIKPSKTADQLWKEVQ